MLAQRLRLLERRGLVRREPLAGRPGRYTLTPAGESVTPVIWAIGHWAAEWTFGDPAEEDCDGRSLMWRLHQHAIAAKLPRQRTVLHLSLTGAGAAEGWLKTFSAARSPCAPMTPATTSTWRSRPIPGRCSAGWSASSRSVT